MSPVKAKKKAKLKPKLRPSKMLTEQSSTKVDALGFGEFVGAERHVDGETTVPVKLVSKNVSSRIKPRDATPTNTPHTPEHDDYDHYGFSLTSSPSNDNVLSPCGDEESDERQPIRSPLAIRRAQSSDSYISDESSTSEEENTSNLDLDKTEDVAPRAQGSTRDSVDLTISRSGDESRHATTPYSVASIDDQGIAHELLTYSFATKLKGSSNNNNNQNGRKAPTHSALTVSPAPIFDDQISAMRTVTAQLDTKPRPQQETKGGKPRTFLTNLQKDSITLSPNGAFKEALHEPTSEAKHEKSPRSSCTLDGALVYSDEEDDSKAQRTTRTSGALSTTTSFSARWQMIAFLCLLNLLAGWTCFSTVPFTSLYPDAEFHVVLYLLGYVLSSRTCPRLCVSHLPLLSHA